MKFDVEFTDTFGGEANYCWIKRATITMPDLMHYGALGFTNATNRLERHLMRKAKAAMGLNGVRGRREDWGDMIAFYPYGSATVMFVTFRE